MLTIRLQRVGKRNNPAFRVVLTDKRNATKSGSFLEILGSYNPQHDGSLVLKKDRITHWLSKGVQASDTLHNLLVHEKVINAPKRPVVAPSKFKKPAVEAPVAEAAAESAGEMVDAPQEAKQQVQEAQTLVEEQLEKK